MSKKRKATTYIPNQNMNKVAKPYPTRDQDAVANIIRLCSLTKSTTLELMGRGLDEIPDEIYSLIHLKKLQLRQNNIKEISHKVSQLQNLEDISLLENKIENLPVELSELPNLKRVHLSNNKIVEFPTKFLQHEKLEHLCLRNNLIEVLPENIGEMKIFQLELANNKIKQIPLTYGNAEFFLNLGLHGNPLIDPPYALFTGGPTQLLKYLLEKERGRVFTIPFMTELKTTFKQYLIYFGDFVKSTKGKRITFEVKDVEEGIEFEVKTENNTDSEIEEVKTYMQEYVSFIKTRVEEIKPQFEIQVDNSNKEFILLELRSQVRHLQTQVEIQAARNASLVDDRDRYYELLSNLTQTKNHITITNQNSTENTLSQKHDMHFNMQSNIPILLKDLTTLRKLIPLNEDFAKNELEAVDTDLLELEECSFDASKVNKSTFKKLKRVLDEINDDNSNLNKVIKGSQKAIKVAQDVGKTYNNFAEWLALPQVPKVFLGKD